MVEVTPERFEELVGAALDSIPPELARRIRNVAIIIEDEPPRGQRNLLGLYEGVPLTERGDYFGVLPDRITLFRRPLSAHCATEDELVEQVRVTVLHEIAHYFGISDERLHEIDRY